MGPRSSVKDIAHDMKMIYYEPLDKVAQCNYKIRCPSYTYYRVYDLVIIGFLVLDFRLLRDKFLDNICKILRKCLTHL